MIFAFSYRSRIRPSILSLWRVEVILDTLQDDFSRTNRIHWGEVDQRRGRRISIYPGAFMKENFVCPVCRFSLLLVYSILNESEPESVQSIYLITF